MNVGGAPRKACLAGAGALVLAAFSAVLFFPADNEPKTPPVTSLLALGDSVMAGAACNCDRPATSIANRVSQIQHNNVALHDMATSGATTDYLQRQLSRSEGKLNLAESDAIIMLVGANDLAPDAWNQACDSTCETADGNRLTQDLMKLFERIRYGAKPGARIVVGTYWNVTLDGKVAAAKMSPKDRARSVRLTALTNKAIRDASAQYGAEMVDLDVLFHGEDKTADPSHLLAADGDHLNSEGTQRMVDSFVEILTKPA